MTILKVSSSTDSGALACAICYQIRQGKEVDIVSMGPVPLNKGVKAVAIAKKIMLQENRDIAMEPFMADVKVDGEMKTVINLHIFEVVLEDAKTA